MYLKFNPSINLKIWKNNPIDINTIRILIYQVEYYKEEILLYLLWFMEYYHEEIEYSRCEGGRPCLKNDD